MVSDHGYGSSNIYLRSLQLARDKFVYQIRFILKFSRVKNSLVLLLGIQTSEPTIRVDTLHFRNYIFSISAHSVASRQTQRTPK